MKVHEIIVYTHSGLEVAKYPGGGELNNTTSFFTASRIFAMENGFGELQEVVWMKKKCNWMHSEATDLSFAIITDAGDDPAAVRQCLQSIKDGFLATVPDGTIRGVVKDEHYDRKLRVIVKQLGID